MTQVVPFNAAKLPAHIAARAKGKTNSALTSHVGNGGFPVLSIKGKTFTIIKDQVKTTITRELDGEKVAAAALEVVIVAANPNLSKVWYQGGYEEGASGKPDCFSNDSIAPDSQVETPQAKKCAVCPKNVWGSGSNGKGKACSDNRRIAIAAPNQLNEPMLLRVPPASLKPLAEYGRKLDNRGTTFDAVITKVKFDMEEATPKLAFAPVGFLSEEQLAQVDEMATSDKVKQIIGVAAAPVEETAAVEDDGFAEFDKAAKPTPAPKLEAPKPAKKAAVSDDELEQAVAPAKKAAPAEAKKDKPAEPAKKPAKGEELESELDGLLAQWDD